MNRKGLLYFVLLAFLASSQVDFRASTGVFMQGMKIEQSIDKTLVKEENYVAKEFLEAGKIILLSTGLSIAFGIMHDLITTNICFDYFASDLTHHGPATREYFPAVYKSNNKLLYALLWGTIATCWAGAIAGALWAITARYNPEKITWRQLVVPSTIFLSALLVSSVVIGVMDYKGGYPLFETVADMHIWAYRAGFFGAVLMAVYILKMPGVQKNIVKLDVNGISLDLAQILMP